MSEIITRFAPSPTGNLHIGGIRTALINYIFTKKAELEICKTTKKGGAIHIEESSKSQGHACINYNDIFTVN